jgi:hypothetical protein
MQHKKFSFENVSNKTLLPLYLFFVTINKLPPARSRWGGGKRIVGAFSVIFHIQILTLKRKT